MRCQAFAQKVNLNWAGGNWSGRGVGVGGFAEPDGDLTAATPVHAGTLIRVRWQHPDQSSEPIYRPTPA